MDSTRSNSNSRLKAWKALPQEQQFFAAYATVLLLSLFVGIAGEWYFLAGLPAVLLLVYLTVVDIKAVFSLLLIFIPLSTELQLPNGLGIHLPTEPLMVGLLLVGILLLARHGKDMDARFLRHPISILLLLHLGWMAVTVLLSEQFVVSLKFLVAKVWYIATFYFLASRMLDGVADLRRFTWSVLLPLLLTIVVITIRHAMAGFSFADIHFVLNPFYRNHVTYAALVVLFLPFLWFVRLWYPKGSWQRRFLWLCLPVFLVAIQLSYTRAAYVAVVAAIGAYYIIRWRLTRWAIGLAVAGAIAGLAYMIADNRYLDYAPNYETTVSHQDFNNLLEATYQMEDISTMERLYRWVAGFNMLATEPLFGFGPGNFYFFYKTYTVTSFTTYVSDNPEQSGIHNYYLMIAVEQGLPGLVIFLLLCFYALVRAEDIYHNAPSRRDAHIAMMAALCLIIILILQIINDLIETDKVGPFFFICLMLLVNVDLSARPALSPGSGREPEPDVNAGEA